MDADDELQYSKIQVSHYLSIAVMLAEQGGRIIRQVHATGDLKRRDKGEDDPVTIADVTVQRTIEDCFKHFFPSLVVEGEESQESMASVKNQTDPNKLSIDFIDKDILLKYQNKRAEFNQMMKEVYGDEILDKFDEFSTKNATVWVDPLDGTQEFVNGNLSGVTVLIGLAIDGVPKIGVVHNPFKNNDPQCSGITIFGTQEHGAFQLELDPAMSEQDLMKREPVYLEPFDIGKQYAQDSDIRVACSLSHFNEKFTEALKMIEPVQIHRLGGAGNKVNRIALDEVDIYFQPRGGLGFWDICAPEVIIKAMGGLCHKMPTKENPDEFANPVRLSYDRVKNGGSTKLPAFTIGKTAKLQMQTIKRLAQFVKM